MPTKTLKVVPKPEDGTFQVFDGPDNAPIMYGKGDLTFLCGSCGRVLLDRMMPQQLHDVVYECAACGAFNMVTG